MTTRYLTKGYIHVHIPRLTFAKVSTNDERQTALLDMTNVLAVSVAIDLSFIALVNPRPHMLFPHPRTHMGGGGCKAPMLFRP